MFLNEIIDSLENLNINNPCTDSEIVNSEQSNSEIHQSLEEGYRVIDKKQRSESPYLNCTENEVGLKQMTGIGGYGDC